MAVSRSITFLGREIKREILLPGSEKLLPSGAGPGFSVINWLSVESDHEVNIHTQICRHAGGSTQVESTESKSLEDEKINDENITGEGFFPGTKIIYSWSDTIPVSSPDRRFGDQPRAQR